MCGDSRVRNIANVGGAIKFEITSIHICRPNLMQWGLTSFFESTESSNSASFGQQPVYERLDHECSPCTVVSVLSNNFLHRIQGKPRKLHTCVSCANGSKLHSDETQFFRDLLTTLMRLCLEPHDYSCIM
jgi:hypothetical protein